MLLGLVVLTTSHAGRAAPTYDFAKLSAAIASTWTWTIKDATGSAYKEIFVPPFAVPPPQPAIPDFEGAQLDFTNVVRHMHGRVQVGVPPTRDRLWVKLVDLPLGKSNDPDKTLFCVLLDHKRLERRSGHAEGIRFTTEDRAYCIKPNLGAKTKAPTKTVMAPAYDPGLKKFLWRPWGYKAKNPPPPPAFSATAGDLKTDAQGVKLASFFLELPLPADGDLECGPPMFGMKSGFCYRGPASTVGFGLTVTDLATPEPANTLGPRQATLVGAVPEALGKDRWLFEDRSQLRTLVFARPRGHLLKMMTWNVKRFTSFMTAMEPSTAFPSSKAANADIGRFLAPYDIVGIQEGWNTDDVKAILAAANQRRADLGMTPYHLIGPVDFDPKPLDGAAVTKWVDETQGGVWLFSRYPPVVDGRIVFKDCRGEDCIKAKGVLWARLWLGAGAPDCKASGRCEVRPDDFIDVFNMHTNADTTICSSSDAMNLFMTAIEAGVGLPLFDSTIASGFYCTKYGKGTGGDDPMDSSDANVRIRQLKQARAFLDEKADPDRHAIVMGDMNSNSGRLVDDPWPSEYAFLQGYSGCNRAPATNVIACDDADWLNEWRDPYGFDWDIDHGDLYRERRPNQKESERSAEITHDGTGADTTKGQGTWIGPDLGTDVDPDQTGDDRFDYIFVYRPTGTARPRWVAARPELPLIWQTLWPYGDGVTPEFDPPKKDKPAVRKRLSDHKPVLATLEFVNLEGEPPKFHPSWRHQVGMRVTSVFNDGKDCFAGVCGELDQYAKLWSRSYTATTNQPLLKGLSTAECGGVSSSYPADVCMAQWGTNYTQGDAGGGLPLELAYDFGAQLWEADTDKDDEYYSIDPGKHPQMHLDLSVPFYRIVDFDGQTRPANAPYDYYFTDNYPIQYLGNRPHSHLGLRMEWQEIPQQP